MSIKPLFTFYWGADFPFIEYSRINTGTRPKACLDVGVRFDLDANFLFMEVFTRIDLGDDFHSILIDCKFYSGSDNHCMDVNDRFY